ncbi:isochorismatase [Bordetella hinzii]|uniref:isochorismatase family protein n=1 Tax=Bordetella hinzii TaxID=103855 RepID=UPI0003FE9623|nr:isochorismatase family protein [Bordetella hinzii]AKQ57660.1 Streptothricin hydrolase [Bordetella hinzii]KCB32104.1 isochorismatase family protein [Bordetella hinzii L60]SNV57251.1 isochorismatase [Bordetella hinzii]
MPAALLIIDVQEGLFRTDAPPADAPRVIARINALAARARAARPPVVFVQHESPSGTPLARGTPGWSLDRDLDVHPQDRIVRKTTPDSFQGTDLSHWLWQHAVDEVVICGYATEFCVDTTARRAAGLGLHVTLVSDGHTTCDRAHAKADAIRAHHNATLPAIRSFGVTIRAVPAEAVAFAAALAA